jgi:hypothetical protein
MANIPQKWIDFALKYQALPTGLKQTWYNKLTEKQKNFLNQVLQSLEFQKVNQTSAINNTPASTTKPSFDFKLTSPNNNFIEIKKPVGVENTELAVNKTQTVNPKILNMQMIMPNQNFDLGFASKTAQAPVKRHDDHTLSKQAYLKSKASQNFKNTLTQLALVILALALPIGSIAFALNNSSSVKDIGAGKKTFAQVLAERSTVNAEGSDLEFKAWIADFNDIKTEDRSPDADPDQDGLTNLDEFLLKTIPTNAQSCGNARLDGENILASIDPASCKPVNFNDPAIAAKFDGVVTRTKINYRLSLIALDRYKNSKAANLPTKTEDTDIDFTKNATLQIINKTEAFKASDLHEVAWIQNSDVVKLPELAEKQIVAYPTNATPGQPGNIYLSGKSLLKTDQNDVVDTGTNIFTKLDQLERGDMLVLTVKTKDDKTRSFFYKVQTQNLHLASDQKQFGLSKPGNSELTIATPWPDYSPEHRLIVRAILDRVE